MENLALAEEVLALAEAHPENFDMSDWVKPCGTAACLFGHAMLLSGYTVRPRLETGISRLEFVRPDGTAVPEYAEEDEGRALLGLTKEEFEGGDDMPDFLPYLNDDEAIARFREIITAERDKRKEAVHG